MPEPSQSSFSEQHPPGLIVIRLRDSLTDEGIRQWWTGRSRYLGGERPCDVWKRDEERVDAAAVAFAEGYYL